MTTTNHPLTTEQHEKIAKLISGPDFRLLLKVVSARFDMAMLRATEHNVKSDLLKEDAAKEIESARKYSAFISVTAELARDAGSDGLTTVTLNPTKPEDLQPKE